MPEPAIRHTAWRERALIMCKPSKWCIATFVGSGRRGMSPSPTRSAVELVHPDVDTRRRLARIDLDFASLLPIHPTRVPHDPVADPHEDEVSSDGNAIDPIAPRRIGRCLELTRTGAARHREMNGLHDHTGAIEWLAFGT